MSKRYLSWEDPKEEKIKEATASAEDTKPEPETEHGVVTNAPFVNLREAPSERASVLELVPRDWVVDILESRNGFYKIRTRNGIVGWIVKSFIQKVELK